MFVEELIPDLKEILGGCIDATGYRRLSDGVKLLHDKMLLDAAVAEIAVCVCDNFVTLPAEVQNVLSVKVGGRPALIRNEWFSYHINGPGDSGRTACRFADVLGTFCTFRDLPRACNLVAKINSAQDAGSEFRVYGYDATGKRIMTPGPEGALVDGFLVPTLWENSQAVLAPNVDAAPCVQIAGILKEATNDFIELYAVDPDTNELISTVGIYRPNETTPRYQRIRVEAREVVFVKFRRRSMALSSPQDWINCDNRLAIVNATRAAKCIFDGQLDVAATYMALASQLIAEENRSNKPGGMSPPQVVVDGIDGGNSNLFYGGCGWR